MSITKDFEKYGYRDLPPSERYYPAVQTEELLDHARALEKTIECHAAEMKEVVGTLQFYCEDQGPVLDKYRHYLEEK